MQQHKTPKPSKTPSIVPQPRRRDGKFHFKNGVGQPSPMPTNLTTTMAGLPGSNTGGSP